MNLYTLEFFISGGIPPYNVTLEADGFNENKTVSSDGIVLFNDLPENEYIIKVVALNGICVISEEVSISDDSDV